MVNLYSKKLRYKYKNKDKVKWNNKIFKKCPFEVDEVKTIEELSSIFNWWEVVPIKIYKSLCFGLLFIFGILQNLKSYS